MLWQLGGYMVNRDLLSAKLADLNYRMERVRVHAPQSEEHWRTNPTLDIIAFYLMLCVQICSDIASHLIADEQWPVAKTLARRFQSPHAIRCHHR